MAVAFDAVGPSSSGVQSSGSTTVSWTHTNVGSGVALFVAIAVDASPDTMTVSCKLDPAGANTTIPSLGSIRHSNDSTAGYLALFGLPNVSSGAHTITGTASAAPSNMEGGSLSFTGADTTTPFSAIQSGASAGNSTTPSLTFTGSTFGNMVAGAVADGNVISSITSGTSRWIMNGSGLAAAGHQAGATIDGGGSVTLSWTATADWWAVQAVEVLVPTVTPDLTFSSMFRSPMGAGFCG